MTAELDDLRITRLLHDGSAAAATAAAETQVAASSMGMQDALLQVDDEAGEPIEDAGDPRALALLLHTSGTTSRPKAVPLRQRNLFASSGGSHGATGCTPTTWPCASCRCSTCTAWSATLLARCRRAALSSCRRSRRSTFWHDVARNGATWYTAVPTIHPRLLARASDHPDAPRRGPASASSARAPRRPPGACDPRRAGESLSTPRCSKPTR